MSVCRARTKTLINGLPLINVVCRDIPGISWLLAEILRTYTLIGTYKSRYELPSRVSTRCGLADAISSCHFKISSELIFPLGIWSNTRLYIPATFLGTINRSREDRAKIGKIEPTHYAMRIWEDIYRLIIILSLLFLTARLLSCHVISYGHVLIRIVPYQLKIYNLLSLKYYLM